MLRKCKLAAVCPDVTTEIQLCLRHWMKLHEFCFNKSIWAGATSVHPGLCNSPLLLFGIAILSDTCSFTITSDAHLCSVAMQYCGGTMQYYHVPCSIAMVHPVLPGYMQFCYGSMQSCHALLLTCDNACMALLLLAQAGIEAFLATDIVPYSVSQKSFKTL